MLKYFFILIFLIFTNHTNAGYKNKIIENLKNTSQSRFQF